MALNWRIDEIKDYNNLCYRTGDDGEIYLKAVTEALIWATLSVELGKITEKNWKNFFARINFVEKVLGTSLRSVKGPIFISPGDVKAHIGLKTNVVDQPDGKWLKRIFVTHEDRCLRECEEEESDGRTGEDRKSE